MLNDSEDRECFDSDIVASEVEEEEEEEEEGEGERGGEGGGGRVSARLLLVCGGTACGSVFPSVCGGLGRFFI